MRKQQSINIFIWLIVAVSFLPLTAFAAPPMNLNGHPEPPVAYWSFDDCTAKDNTGNGHDGMIMGKSVCVDGAKGKGLRLNSANAKAIGDYVKIPWDEKFRSDDFTIVALVNFDGGECYNKANMIFSIPSHETWNNAIAFEWHCDDNRIEGYVYNKLWRPMSPFNLRWNWHVVTMTKTGTSLAIEVDGVQVLQTNDLPAQIDYGTPRSILIGADDDSGGDGKGDTWWFKGMIDEVYFYNPSLKHEDIKEIYNAIIAERDVNSMADNYPPAGAVDAYNNVLWSPNNKPVEVLLAGYVFDEISATRDKSGCGVSNAYLMVNGTTKIVLKDENTNLINDKCNYTVTTELEAIKGAKYPIELYATDTNPLEAGGTNGGLVHSTMVTVPHDMGK